MVEAVVLMPETAPPSAPIEAPSTKGKPGPKPGYKPFNNELTPEEFFALLADIPDADWPKSLVYIWRRDPYTDNTNGGRDPKYIDVRNGAITETDIKTEHGSGTYKLQLNTQDKYVAHTIASLEDPAYPPHIPPGDWMTNPRNKKWHSWKPLIEKWWQQKLKDLAGPAAPSNGSDPAMQELASIVRQLAMAKPNEADPVTKQLVAWALQQTADEKKADREERREERNADSPDKMASLIRAVKELIVPAAPAAQTDDKLLTFVLAQLAEVQKQNGELMRMMLAEKKQEANPLNQVETMVKLVSAVAGIAQPAAPKEPWVEFAETIAPQALPVLDKFATGLVMMNTRPNPAQQRPQPQPIPQTQPVAQQPPPQVVTVQPQPIPPAQPEQPAQPEMDTMERSMIIQIATLSAQALNLGMMGDQFADQICTRIFNDRIYDEFCQQVPKDQIIGKFKQVPEAWALLQGHEGVLQSFIDSFYDYGAEQEIEETKSISPEQPVKPKKAKKSK